LGIELVHVAGVVGLAEGPGKSNDRVGAQVCLLLLLLLLFCHVDEHLHGAVNENARENEQDKGKLSTIASRALSDSYSFTGYNYAQSFIDEANWYSEGNAIISSRTTSASDVKTCTPASELTDRIVYTDGQTRTGSSTATVSGYSVDKTFGPSSSYYTIQAPGIFVLSVKNSEGIDWVRIEGTTKWGGFGEVNKYSTTVDGYGVKVKVTSQNTLPASCTSDPSIIHIWIFERNCEPNHMAWAETECDSDVVEKPSASFDYILVSEFRPDIPGPQGNFNCGYTGVPTFTEVTNLVKWYLQGFAPR